ncbi:Ig-like domain-containing protein [Oceanisphaera sp.]|uniref:Ig-like domain-containing protein n=1 Tax=Oceanisphaera sp. TaxID=1929979 RepID=UPI003A8D9A79
MKNLILIEIRDGKHVIEHALTQLQTLIAQPGAVYTLVDKDSQTPPQELVLKRKGNNLEAEVEQQLVARIEGFYDEDLAATYSLDGSLTPADGMVLGSADASVAATGAEGEVVWQAGGVESSGLTAFNSGLGAITLIGGGVALAAAGGGSSASESTKDSTSASTDYELTIAAAAGPFQSAMAVEVYDEAGNLLANGEYNADTGQFKVSITNGYRGPLLVVLIDTNGDAGDYLDEASNTLVSLDGSLRAMAYADGGSDVHVSVTPLTELAVRTAGISGNQVTEDNLAVNDQIAELFGVSNILAPVVTVLEGSYNPEDGINEAELYGNVLALLSGVDQHSGGLFNSLAQLQSGITIQDNGKLAISQATVELLASGVDAFQSGANADKAELSQVLIQPPVVSAAAGGINAAEKMAGVEVGIKGVQAGDTVTLQWGSQVYISKIVAEAINSAGRVLLTVPGSVVEAAGDGTVAVSYHINDKAESPAVLIAVDTLAPAAPTMTLAADSGSSASDGISQQGSINVGLASDASSWEYSLDGGHTWSAGSGTHFELPDNRRYEVDDVQVRQLDSMGNVSDVTSNNSAITIDTTEPVVSSVSLSDSALKVGETATLTIVFSEAVTGFSNAEITLANGTLSDVTSSDGGITWTGTFTPSDNIEAAENVIRVGTGFTDLAGNAPLVGGSTENYSIDTKAPSVSIGSSAAALKAGETATLTFTFSEAPTDFSADDVSVDSGALSGFAVAPEDPLVYTATYTPAVATENAAMAVTVGTGYSDAAGNTGTGNSLQLAVDTKAPTLSYSSMVQLGANGRGTDPQVSAVGSDGAYVVTWRQGYDSIFVQRFNADGTITGNAPVQLEAISKPNGYDTDPQVSAVGNDGSYVVTWSGVDSEGDHSIFVQRFNADGTITNNAPVQLEAIGNSINNDITPQISAVGSDGAYVVTWSGVDSEGDWSIFVQRFNADGTITHNAPVQLEAIGNPDGGSDTDPQITAVGSDGAYVVTWQGYYHEWDHGIFVQRFNADGTITNNAPVQLEAIGSSNDRDYAARVSAVGSDGAYVVTWYGNSTKGYDNLFVQRFNADGSTTNNTPVQLEAPVNPLTSYRYIPQVTAVGSDGAYVVTWHGYYNGGDHGIFVQRFNADGTTTNNAPVRLDAIGNPDGYNAAPQVSAVGNDGAYVVTWYGTDSEGDRSIFVQRVNADDTIGNNAPVRLDAPNGLDTGPQVSAVGNDGAYVVTWQGVGSESGTNTSIFVQRFYADGTLDSPVTINAASLATATTRVQSSEAGTAYLVNSSVTVSELSDITGAADNLWNEATITEASTVTELAAAGLADGDYVLYTADEAGNLSAPSPVRMTVDATEPMVSSVVLSDTALKVGETATLTIVFSEAVTGFTNDDIALANGTLSDVTSTDNITWTGTFTPSNDIEAATNVISVGTTFTDLSGNAPLAGKDSANYAIDTTEPVVSSVTLSTTELKVGDTAILSIVFSEAVTGFDNSDISLGNGTLSDVTSSDGGVTWTGTFTPSDDVENASNVIRIGTGFTDLAGNAPESGLDTANYTIDTTEPVVSSVVLSDTALKVGETATLTIVFSEAVTGFGNSDITLANGTLSAVTSSDGGVTWTGTFTPTDDIEAATNIISVGTTFTDLAGNAPLAGKDSAEFEIDTKAPTVSSVAISGATGALNNTLNAGDVVSVTVTMSDATSIDITDGIPQLALNIGDTIVQAVYDGASSTSTALVFKYTILADQADANGISIDANSLDLNGGTLTDAAGNTANLDHAEVADNAGYLVDTTAPTVSSVAISGASGVLNNTLNAGDVVSVTVTMSEATSIGTTDGTPQLALNIGGTTVQAIYASGSGSTALVFQYTISNETDTDGISIDANSLDLNGGTLTDAAGNAANLSHVAVADNGNFMVDTTAPTLSYSTMVQLEAIDKTDGHDSSPQVSAVGNGGAYVVTWYGRDSEDDFSIFVQRFNADGTTDGNAPVQLEAIDKTDGNDYAPQVSAVGSDGAYVVTWYGHDSDNSIFDNSIFVQRFNANGTTDGNTPVQLEAIGNTTGDNRNPQVSTVGSDGAYVVTWYGHDSEGDYSIFVQRFNAAGTITGNAPVQLEAIDKTDGHDSSPQVSAVGSDGAYVVTWSGTDSEGDSSIFVQRFNADGTITGNVPVKLEAIGNTKGDDLNPQITAVGNDGAYVVTWYGQDRIRSSGGLGTRNGDYSIFVQRFNTDGTVGDNVPVKLEAIGNTKGDDRNPQITAVGSDGAYVVTWYGHDRGGDHSIFVQRFNADGTIDGNTLVQLEAIGNTSGNDYRPQVSAVGSDGAYVVTWYGRDSEGDDSIFVQRFNAEGTITGNAPVQLEAIGNTTGYDQNPQVSAIGSDGAYVVTWQGEDSEGDYSIFVQRFNADGTLADSTTVNAASLATATTRVQSSEAGTAYLVNSNVTVNDLADITGAADNLWNAATITGANTDTDLAVAGLADGDYVVYAADAAGNLSAASPVRMTVDTTAPAAPAITSVTDNVGNITGTVSSGGHTDDTALVVRVSLSGTNAVPGDRVQLYNNVALLGSAVTLSGSDISNGYVDITTPALSDSSSYVFNAVITDVAGNASPASANHTVTVDTTAPTLSASSPGDDATGVALDSNITLTFDENIALGSSGTITVTNGSDEHIINVSSHDGQLSVSGSTLTINPTADLSAGGSNYHVLVSDDAITDTTGNAFAGISDSTTVGFTTEIVFSGDTSVVVFNLVEGVSSDHSDRTFDANTTYTIYIRVNSTSSALSTDGIGPVDTSTWGKWSGAENLGADDVVVLVGTGNPVRGFWSSTVSNIQGSGNTFDWNTSSEWAARVEDNGFFQRAYMFAKGNVDLWNGVAEIGLLGPGKQFGDVYKTNMPAGMLTSQGLA